MGGTGGEIAAGTNVRWAGQGVIAAGMNLYVPCEMGGAGREIAAGTNVYHFVMGGAGERFPSTCIFTKASYVHVRIGEFMF